MWWVFKYFLPFLTSALEDSLKAGKLEVVRCILMLLQFPVKMQDIYMSLNKNPRDNHEDVGTRQAF